MSTITDMLMGIRRVTILREDTDLELEVDATLRESHDDEAEVTRFPVEDGADITDHVRQLPARLHLECLISDTPLSTLGIANVEATLAGGSISQDAYSLLREWQADAALLIVTTTLRRYESMVLTALSVPRDVANGRAVRFGADFTPIRRVSTEATAVPDENRADIGKAGGQTKTKQTAPAGAAVETQSSILYDLLGLGG